MKSKSAKKISKGVYEYKGYKLIRFGYFPNEQSVWWEAVDRNGDAEYHAHTKKGLMQLIDKEEISDEIE